MQWTCFCHYFILRSAKWNLYAVRGEGELKTSMPCLPLWIGIPRGPSTTHLRGIKLKYLNGKIVFGSFSFFQNDSRFFFSLFPIHSNGMNLQLSLTRINNVSLPHTRDERKQAPSKCCWKGFAPLSSFASLTTQSVLFAGFVHWNIYDRQPREMLAWSSFLVVPVRR